jgi:hypothetical protein
VSPDREQQSPDRRRFRIAGIGDRSPSSAAGPQAHVDDLVPGYALGALEPAEVSAVDAHIRTCAECEGSLTEAQRTVGVLPFTVPLHTPPADSKLALFARVAHARKAAVASALPTLTPAALRTPTLPSSDEHDRLSPVAAGAPAVAHGSREFRAGWLVSVVSLPLLVALVATGFWGMQLQNRLTSQDAQLAELQSELTNFGSGATAYQLSPGEAAPGAEGELVLGADKRAGMVQIDVNSKDGPREFEVMVMRDGKLVPVSQVTVDENGQGEARWELDQPFTEYDSVHIRAKPIDAAEPQGDALKWDSEGALGDTGSGLDIGP